MYIADSAKGRRAGLPNLLLSTTALASTVLALCALTPTQAFAQSDPVATASPEDLEGVTVTGSLVVRNGYKAPTPVTVLGREELEASATITLADAINRLPELSGSVAPTSSANSVSQGSAGLNNLNLRGLGAGRTLVLLDGERLVGASFNNTYNNGGAVDVNVMPSGLVNRVDVVTGGASAAYGSDAVGGVVNFVLDHKFNGFKADVGGGWSDYGDNKTAYVKLTAGTAFANDRGHVEGYASYSRNSQVRGDSRPWTDRGSQLIPNPAYVPGNGQPQYLTTQHVGLSTGAPGGVISAGPLKGIAFGPGGTPYNLQGTPSGIYLIEGNWQDTRTDTTPNIAPDQIIENVFARVSYELTDHIEAFAQYQWAYARTRQAAGLPSTYLGNLTIAANNPFIPDSVRDAMAAAGVTSLPYGLTLIGGGGIGIDYSRYFQRIAVGADGDVDAFGSNWTWNISYENSRSRIINRTPNNPISANLRQAIASVMGPNGAPVCSNPAGGCVPFNPFGVDVNSQAAIDYVTGTGYQRIRLTQDAVALHVNGTPFSNWAGPVSLAFGADWRREAVSGDSSDLDKAAAFNFGNYLTSTGDYHVAEGFIETVIPLASGTSWAKQLDLNAAVRGTVYSTSGYVTTWKVGLTYEPFDDLRFRASRSRDIRAPNLAELFSAGSFGLPTFRDPQNGNVQVVVQSDNRGNPDLDPEIADSTGFGVVMSPSFLPGFQASLDYFDIKIKDAIQSVGGQTFIDLCFQGQTEYCQFVSRNAAGALTLVRITNANVAFVKERGLDIEASYKFPVSSLVSSWDGDISLRFLGTKVFDFTTSALGIVTKGDGILSAGSGGLGAPSFRANASITYDRKPFSAMLTMRYVSSGVISNTYVECTSGCPASTAFNPTVSDAHVPSHTLYDAAFSYELFDGKSEFYVAIDNLFNKNPPNIPGSIGTGYLFGQNNSGYDRIGRMYRAGIRLTF